MSAIADGDVSVRATACHLAMLIKLWNVLEKTLRADGAGRVRAGAIRGLLASPDWPIPIHLLERALNSKEAFERY